MRIDLKKFIAMLGYDIRDSQGRNDNTQYKRYAGGATITQTWGKHIDVVTFTTVRHGTKISMVIHGKSPDDWERLAQCAAILRRITKGADKRHKFYIDITYALGEPLVLQCELVVSGNLDEV